MARASYVASARAMPLATTGLALRRPVAGFVSAVDIHRLLPELTQEQVDLYKCSGRCEAEYRLTAGPKSTTFSK
jgi:hypothetical protein